MLQIYCKNINKSKSFPIGISLLDVYSGFNLDLPYGPVSAKVNNKVESLTFRLYNNKGILDEYRNPKVAFYKVKELYEKYAKEEK